MSTTDPRRFLGYLEAERNASLLYRALADTTDGERREALLELADIEDQHTAHWIAKCAEYGIDVPPAPAALDPDDAQLVSKARSLGLTSILDVLDASCRASPWPSSCVDPFGGTVFSRSA